MNTQMVCSGTRVSQYLYIKSTTNLQEDHYLCIDVINEVAVIETRKCAPTKATRSEIQKATETRDVLSKKEERTTWGGDGNMVMK